MKKAVSFIVGIVLFSLLPVIGWGVYNIDGFIGNPFRLSFILMMATLSLLVVIFVPNQGRGYGDGDNKKLVKRQKLTILFLQIAPLLIVILSPFFDRYHILTLSENNILRFIGLVLSAIGFSLMNWSIIVLGKQFSINVTIQNNHKLITKGPYKFIRHPRYLGIIVFLIGIPLIFLSMITLLFDLLVIGVLLWRIKDEEELMSQEFKDEWNNYRKTTYSLFPFIY
jgi:protein-S-isoprenylcysteine O-methyltransferase Ste14